MVELIIGWIVKYIGGIIGVLVLLAVAAWLSKIKGELEKLLSSKSHFNFGVKSSVEHDKEMYMELSKLTVGVNASRTTVFKFHNGSSFNTQDPIWKISSTHETCESGVSSEIGKNQDIKSSLLYPLLNALFTGSEDDGISKVDVDDECGKCHPCLLDKGIFQIRPSKLNNRYVYAFFAERGSKYSIISPLTTSDNTIIGFLLIDYCVEGETDPEDVVVYNRKICDGTIKMSNLLG